ncbi:MULTISPECIES: CBS domain-containing protein [Streptomyces]|uniref:CBS domain-containing protein n=1 Tax=Streptomyces galilaeus TaxID=33899 RepID=A0ABW9IM37_STRGJ
MKHNKVGSVMTMDVVRVVYGPVQGSGPAVADHRISGLPVVDEDDRVIGGVSEHGLMAHQAAIPDPYEPSRRFRFAVLTPAARRRAAKATARTAGQLMSTPPVTMHADDTIIEAARTMAPAACGRGRRGSARS